jgi:energy-coupling factor transporter ATP-binding protein EcfA2
MGRHLNPRWDVSLARGRLVRLGIPLERKVGKLSVGQRAQVALSLALAKRPELLLLDEPVASLDPLARREFLQGLMGAVAEEGTTVLLSSHLLADLERVCDYLIILRGGRVQVLGDVDDLLAEHRVLVGPGHESASVEGVASVVGASHTERQSILLVRMNRRVPDGWVSHDASPPVLGRERLRTVTRAFGGRRAAGELAVVDGGCGDTCGNKRRAAGVLPVDEPHREAQVEPEEIMNKLKMFAMTTLAAAAIGVGGLVASPSA